MRQILKQTSWLILAQVLTKVIGFFYTIYLARNLGVSDFGLFSVGLAYFSIISAISDFGFNRYLIREISKEDGQRWEIICNLLMLRLTVVCLFFGIFAVFLYLFDADKMRVSVILLSSLAVLPQTVAITFDGVFIALRRLQFSALAAVISSLSTVLLGLLLVSRGFAVYGAVNALILGQAIFAITFLLLVSFHVGIKLSQVKLSVIKKALKGSLPYGLLGVLGLLYFRIDTVMLSYLRGNFETGIYGVAYKFLEAVTFIPSAFSMALFPVLARIHDSSPKDIRKLYFKSFKIMLGLGILMFLGYVLILPEIITVVLPNYLSSITAIRILSLSIPFMFIHVPAVQVLLSTDKFLKPIILLSLLTLSFNLIFNLIFIPKFGYISAAWITTLSEVLSFVVFYWLVKRKVLDVKG